MTNIPPIDLNAAVDLSTLNTTEPDSNTAQGTTSEELVAMLTDAANNGDIDLNYMDAKELTAAVLGLVQTLVAIHGVEFAQVADTWAEVFSTVLEQRHTDA